MRLPSGCRDYGAEDEARLWFITTAQRPGFRLDEIAEILSFKERGERPCGYVLSVLDNQAADLDRRIGELVALRADLVAVKAGADRLASEGACYGSIVEHAAVDSALAPRTRRARH